MRLYSYIPVINLCNADFSSSLAQTDPGGGGMGQNVATNRLLGVCLEAESEGCTRCLNLLLLLLTQLDCGNDMVPHITVLACVFVL